MVTTKKRKQIKAKVKIIKYKDPVPKYLHSQFLRLNFGDYGDMKHRYLCLKINKDIEEDGPIDIYYIERKKRVLSWGILYGPSDNKFAQFFTAKVHRGNGYFTCILKAMCKNRKNKINVYDDAYNAITGSLLKQNKIKIENIW